MSEHSSILDFGFYNLDCMEGMKCFPDQYFDLAIVDPPYGINVGKTAMGAGGGVAPHRNRSAANLRTGRREQGIYPVRREEETNRSSMGGGTGQLAGRNPSEIRVGGVSQSLPKFIRRSMTATHRTPDISGN